MSGNTPVATMGQPQVYLPGEAGGYAGLPPVALGGLPGEDESGILARLRRRKFTFMLVFVLVLGLVTLAYLAVPRSYRSTASVLVSSANVVLGAPQAPAANQDVGDPADLESQGVVLASTVLLRDVLARPGIRAALIGECEQSQPPPWLAALKLRLLGPALPCAALIDDPGEVVTLQSRYVVLDNGRSRVLDVSFASPSAAVAQLMTNTLVQAYLDLRTNEKLRPRDAAIDWLHREIARLGDKLAASERTIEAFLAAHDLVKGQTASIASERLSGLSQQLAMAQADQAAAAGRMGQTAHGGADVSDVLGNAGVAGLKAQLAQVNGQLAQLESRYGPAYPGLMALRQERDGLRGELGAETGRVVSSVGHDYQAAASRVASLAAQVAALKRDVGAGDSAMTQIAALQRDTDVDRELYLDLTKRVNELEAERRLVVGDARLVNVAELPDRVFFPKKTTFGLTGLLLASALATVAALLRDRGDRTVRAADRLQAATGLRVLAHIPRVRRVAGGGAVARAAGGRPGAPAGRPGGKGGSRLAKQLGLPSAFQEAIRGLYAECMLVGAAEPLRTLLVTSSHPVEGKTFVTLALAHFAAAAGKRVLVLECDLRRPSFARTLSLRPERGVSDYLGGRARAEEVVVPTGIKGLHVILAGRPAINSTELLSDRRMRQLLDWAASQYDLVLVDTPPSQLLHDARVLARQVDGVLYCAQWGQSQTASVLDGVAAVQAAGGHVVGLVLDRVEAEQYRLYNAHGGAAQTYFALQAD